MLVLYNILLAEVICIVCDKYHNTIMLIEYTYICHNASNVSVYVCINKKSIYVINL